MIGSFDSLWAVVHSDLGTTKWLANLGITLFALPLIILGPIGGRWAQVYGPFKVAVAGLVAGAFFMSLYGVMPTGGLIFAVAMLHAVSDGFTVSSTGVAVGMTVPEDRQAGAQGVLGGAQALAAGIMAVVTGTLYDQFGRTVAYTVCGVVMLVLVAAGAWLARSAWSLTRPLHVDEPVGVAHLSSADVRTLAGWSGRCTASGRCTTASGCASRWSMSSCRAVPASSTTWCGCPPKPPASSSTTPHAACCCCGATGSSPTPGDGRCPPAASTTASRPSRRRHGRRWRSRAGSPARSMPLTRYFPNNGTTDAAFNIFLATSATHVGEPTDPDEAERVEWLSWNAVRSEIEAGRIRDGLSLTGLLYRLAFTDH